MRTKYFKDFIVLAKSDNTNSFGLYQMIVLAQDGEAYKTHASMYNCKSKGEILKQEITVRADGQIIDRYFSGTELTTKLQTAPAEVIAEAWKKDENINN